MDINGVQISCPYWMNKIKNSEVVIRGFQNGKGDAQSIKFEILKQLGEEKIETDITVDHLQKLARRHRIGIDCSGFAYNFVNFLITNEIIQLKVKSLDEIYFGGINRTNVKRFIHVDFSDHISNLNNLKIGDLIATKKRTHILVVADISNNKITYVHSSYLHTKMRGVHTAIIEMIDPKKDLKSQKWLEVGPYNEKYNEAYFFPESGDGIYRIRPKI